MKNGQFISKALENLCPGKKYIYKEFTDTWEIEWQDDLSLRPTRAAVEAEANRLTQEWSYTEYQRKRSLEYPPIEDYLDAVVKNDNVQLQAYIDACLAVKEKYPKPGE